MGKVYLVGVVSWGVESCDPAQNLANLVDIYTDVRRVITFISGMVQQAMHYAYLFTKPSILQKQRPLISPAIIAVSKPAAPMPSVTIAVAGAFARKVTKETQM